MATSVVNAPAQAGTQQRIYLDESGTLGYSGELFTIALVLVNDLPKLETCMLKNRSTQTEVKASQMKTAQKLALARTVLEQNDIQVYFAKLDPSAAQISERKIDKEFLYDAMVAQALAYYLEHHAIPDKLPYRISMDMRSGLRESYEDMVGESIGNVLMQRKDPLVTGLEVRFLDSRYSMGIQAADLFSNIYRIALTQPDSPCHSFLHKYEEEGRLHADFTFGLPQLADQMTQIAAELRSRVADEETAEHASSKSPTASKPAPLPDETASRKEAPAGTSRSSRRRRSRANHREQESSEHPHETARKAAGESAPQGGATAPDMPAEQAAQKAPTSNEAIAAEPVPALPQMATTRRERRKAASIAGSKHTGEAKADHAGEPEADHTGEDAARKAGPSGPADSPSEQPAQAPAKKETPSEQPAQAPAKKPAAASSKATTASSKTAKAPSTASSKTAKAPSKTTAKAASATSGKTAAKKKTAAKTQSTAETPPAANESRSA